MKKGFRIAIILILVLGAVAGLGKVAYKRYEDRMNILKIKKKKETISISTPVAVTKARRGTIEDMLSLTGRIHAHSEVNIFSTVPGKVKNILISEGDKVKKDQVLLYIDRSEAGLVYAPTPVKSTIEGVVKRVMVEKGAYIVPQNPLVQVIDMNPVEMVVHFPEKDVKKVKKGMTCSIELIAFQSKIFRGTVYKVSPVLDPMSGTLEARILIQNQAELIKPGMFGSTDIIARRHSNTIVIPVASIVVRNDKNAVFVVKDGTADMRFPEFGIKQGESIEVLEGIREGEKVIVIGQQNLNQGDKVSIMEEY